MTVVLMPRMQTSRAYEFMGSILRVSYLSHHTRTRHKGRYMCVTIKRACFRWCGISTTNLAACVCVSSKFDQFLPARFYFVSKRPENFVPIAKFPYAAFGPLFAFHCPLFVTKNNNLGWNRHRRFATHRNMQVQRSRPTVLSARGQ